MPWRLPIKLLLGSETVFADKLAFLYYFQYLKECSLFWESVFNFSFFEKLNKNILIDYYAILPINKK